MIDSVVIPLIKIVVILNALLLAVSYLVLLERKVIAWVQVRLGPMRVGPHGALQPIADAVKLLLKEDITPARADRWVFTAAPVIALVPALVVFAVIPFGSQVELFGRSISLSVTDINVGLLYVVSVASIGVYGLPTSTPPTCWRASRGSCSSAATGASPRSTNGRPWTCSFASPRSSSAVRRFESSTSIR